MRILDLYCCAGGAARGYHDAGFDVTGVDINPQPRYPYRFVQGDAIEFLRAHGHLFDAVHASPPCQRYSRATKQSRTQDNHPDLLVPTRKALVASGKPYIIENVEFAPLLDPVMLCGAMFPELRTYRHRLFESNVPLVAPPHPKHTVRTPRSNVYVEGCFMTVYGHVSPVSKAREVMGIDWPMSQREVTEAIPPAYTRYLGAQLLAYLRAQREEAAD